MNATSSLDPLIRSVRLRRDEIPDPQAWPWSLPAVRALDDLALDPGVTFIVGQNGSGKSTLVEGIAVAAGFNPEGGTTNFNFATREDSTSPLADLLTLGAACGVRGRASSCARSRCSTSRRRSRTWRRGVVRRRLPPRDQPRRGLPRHRHEPLRARGPVRPREPAAGLAALGLALLPACRPRQRGHSPRVSGRLIYELDEDGIAPSPSTTPTSCGSPRFPGLARAVLRHLL